LKTIDKIILGDNQFFGINHMSDKKASELADRFSSIDEIIKVYDSAIDAGITGFMLNSNDRAKEICEYFRRNDSRYKKVSWYPSIPYPHKYANLVAEKGIINTMIFTIVSNISPRKVFTLMSNGSAALIKKDAMKVMRMLIDVEIAAFNGLNIKTIFLQNIITDLLLGLRAKEFILSYVTYIKNKYKVLPGFITMNLPLLLASLNQWSVKDVVICASINKKGYLMCPSIKEYEKALREFDKESYQIMAMSVLASGAIPPEEAFQYVGSLNVDSIVFGASSKKNILNSKMLIDKLCFKN